MAERNAEAPQDPRIDFRIAINVRDIIIDGDEIFGDGVNVAARRIASLKRLLARGGEDGFADTPRLLAGRRADIA